MLESGDLSSLNRDDEILHGDPIGTQLSLGVKVEESEEEEDEEEGGHSGLVDDGTGTGGVIWNGGDSDDECESDPEGSLDDYFLDEEDFENLPSLYSASTPERYGMQLIASVFHEKKDTWRCGTLNWSLSE